MERTDKLLASEINIKECDTGEVYNYIDIGGRRMMIDAGGCNLEKDEITAVIDSINLSFYSTYSLKERYQSIGCFNSSIEIDQEKLKLNLIKLHQRRRLENLLSTRFEVVDSEDECDGGTFLDLGRVLLHIVEDYIDLTDQEMEAITDSLKTTYCPANGDNKARITLEIDNDKLRESLRAIYE